MNEKDQQFFELLQEQIQSEQLRRTQAENQLSQVSQFSNNNKEQNIIDSTVEKNRKLIDRLHSVFRDTITRRRNI